VTQSRLHDNVLSATMKAPTILVESLFGSPGCMAVKVPVSDKLCNDTLLLQPHIGASTASSSICDQQQYLHRMNMKGIWKGVDMTGMLFNS